MVLFTIQYKLHFLSVLYILGVWCAISTSTLELTCDKKWIVFYYICVFQWLFKYVLIALSFMRLFFHIHTCSPGTICRPVFISLYSYLVITLSDIGLVRWSYCGFKFRVVLCKHRHCLAKTRPRHSWLFVVRKEFRTVFGSSSLLSHWVFPFFSYPDLIVV